MARRTKTTGWLVLGVILIGAWSQLTGWHEPEPRGSAEPAPLVRTAPSPQKPVSPPAEVPANRSAGDLRPGYVDATSLNVRARPDAGAEVLLQVPRGTKIIPLSKSGDWLEVPLNNGTSGWVSSRYVVQQQPAAPRPTTPRAPAAPIKAPSYNRAEVVQAIIDQSIRATGGNCPCPYNRDRAGRRCGGRSAYSRPGGAAPICFAEQVTEQMVERYVARPR